MRFYRISEFDLKKSDFDFKNTEFFFLKHAEFDF